MQNFPPALKELLDHGLAAYRRGDLSRAKSLLGRAVARDSRVPRAHDLLARICLGQGDAKEALAHAERALAVAGGVPAYHDTFARTAVAAGVAGPALAQYDKIVKARPQSFGAAYGRAALLLAMGRSDAAVAGFQHALSAKPGARAAGMGLVRALAREHRLPEAAEQAQQMLAAGWENPFLHNIIGNSLFEQGDPAGAAEAFGKALACDEADNAAHSGLSAALGELGRPDEARAAVQRLFRRAPYWSRRAARPEAEILVLSPLRDGRFQRPRRGSGVFAPGNAISQIAADRISFHYLYLCHPEPIAAARSIGPLDAIFNNASSAEVAEHFGYAEEVRSVAEALDLPVINPPEAVALTSRLANAQTVPAATGFIFPKTVRYHVDATNLAETHAAIRDEFAWPVLVRGVFGQKDLHMPLVADDAALAQVLRQAAGGDEDIYVIEYRTEEFRSGIFRKVRCVLIDGAFYPVRVDFNDHWNVHRNQPERDVMLANADLMDNEQTFLADPEAYLGPGKIARFEALARLSGLDFIGVDFNITGQGDIVVFEANAAMNVLEDRHIGHFPYFAQYWERVKIAFEEMLLRRAGKG